MSAIRPSKLPMLAQCPRFDSGSGSEYTEHGDARHKAFASALKGDLSLIAALPEEEERVGVEWAVAYVQTHAPSSANPLELEKRRTFIDQDFNDVQGTPDVVCGPRFIADLKWRKFDYTAQMAAYCLMRFDEVPDLDFEIEAHILFAESQRATVLRFTRESAAELVYGIIERAKDPQAKEIICDYCGWCSRRMVCGAMTEKVNAVVGGRTDWGLEQWHSSEITKPEEMAKALAIARAIKGWCEAVEHHAKEIMVKQGATIPGYELKAKQGNRFISSVSDAYAAIGLPQDEFLTLCELKLTKVVEAYAIHKAIAKKSAEKEVCAKLGEIIQRKPSTLTLVEAKEAPKQIEEKAA